MISDEDVRQLFQSKLLVPGTYGGPGSLQIFRGKSPSAWKDAPAGGCQRHFIVFNKFGVIPEYCFDCYKVLIEPHTVMELFKLLMVFEELALPNNNTRKCIAEGRAKFAGTYKGFVYCRSIEEGIEVCKILENVVTDNISSYIPITLKRGCSEFSRAYPQYAQMEPDTEVMKYQKNWKIHEAAVDKEFTSTLDDITDMPIRATYPPWEIFALQYWLSYAAVIGDISYRNIAGTIVPLPPLPQLKRPPFEPLSPHHKCK